MNELFRQRTAREVLAQCVAAVLLPLCLPCSVFVLEEVLRRLERRASSSCTRWKVARSMMAGWQSWTELPADLRRPDGGRHQNGAGE